MEPLKAENNSIPVFPRRIMAAQLKACRYHCCLYMFALLLATNVLVTESLAKDTDYVIEAPAGFVKKNMAMSKAKLKELKKIYQERFGNLPDTESGKFSSGVFNTVKSLEMADLTWIVTKPGDWDSYIDKDQSTKYLRWKCTAKDKNGKCIYRRIPVEMKNATILYAHKAPSRLELDFPLGKPVRNHVVAADEITAKLLHMPQKAGLKLLISIDAVDVNPGKPEPCCKTYINVTNEYGRIQSKCQTRYPFNSIRTTLVVDPRRDSGIAQKLGFSLLPGKASFTDNNAAIQFSRPGSQNIYLVFKNSGPSIASENICGAGQNGKYNKQVAKYKSDGILKIPVKARAISLEGIVFDNLVEASFKKTSVDLPQLDLFENVGQSGLVSSALSPVITGVSVKWGDTPEEMEKRLIEKEIKARLKVEWKPKKPGPFIMDHKARIKEVVGIGEGYRELSIANGMFTFTQKMTANRFSVIMPGLSDGDGKPGKEYSLALKVHGPADLKNFIVDWSGFDTGAWKEKTTRFEKAEDGWISYNSFIMPLKKNIKPKDTRQYIKIKVKNPGYADKMVFSYSHMIRRTGPVIEGIKLFAARPGQTPSTENSIDFFYPNFLTRVSKSSVLLIPKAVLADGSVKDLEKVGTDAGAARVLLKTDAPEIVELKGLGASAKFSMGEAFVTATIGGAVLDPSDNLELGKKALVSEPLQILVNQLRLSRLLPSVQGDPERYSLNVIGPSDMSKNYKVSWIGAKKQSGSFEPMGDGSFVAEYTGDGLEKIEIEKKGVPVAMLYASSAGQQALIRIYPITPPVTIVEHKAIGDLETSTECRKRLMLDADFIAKVRGGDLRTAAKAACKKTRIADKKASKLTRNLNKKGQQLVTIENSVTITARAVYAPASAQCVWTIKNGGGLALEKKVTPLTDKGICTNTLYGFQNGYNPDAKVLVELRHVMVPNAMGAPMVADENVPVKVSSFKYKIKNFNQ